MFIKNTNWGPYIWNVFKNLQQNKVCLSKSGKCKSILIFFHIHTCFYSFLFYYYSFVTPERLLITFSLSEINFVCLLKLCFFFNLFLRTSITEKLSMLSYTKSIPYGYKIVYEVSTCYMNGNGKIWKVKTWALTKNCSNFFCVFKNFLLIS